MLLFCSNFFILMFLLLLCECYANLAISFISAKANMANQCGTG